MSEVDESNNALASTTEVVNIPLTSDQKLALTNLRLRRSTIQRRSRNCKPKKRRSRDSSTEN